MEENSNSIYLKKAKEAIEYVFHTEYHKSLGIPFPIIKLLLADDPSYQSGMYYITIDQTWQIHLNFGKLPVSYKEFQDEVKVLTRHEIEHYMCCPFDVITHLRMLKCIMNVYHAEFQDLELDINSLCGSIANQAADIIVDTINFQRHPKETVYSEINWIKKGANISMCPRHARLMFLTKAAIWQKDLGIEETDEELKHIVSDLAKLFLDGKIGNKSLFISKTEEYTRTFFRLYKKDQKEAQERQSEGNNSKGNGNQDSPTASSGNGELNEPQEAGGNISNSAQSINHGKPKDGDKNGSALVFTDPDKIKQAIESFASETSIEEFVEIINIAGVIGLTEKEKEIIWFSAQSANMIPIEEYSNRGSNNDYIYPSTWKLGDPIEEIDMMLSFLSSPKFIPGVTTKKWEKSSTEIAGAERHQRDLLLVLDTSSSMGNVRNRQSNMFQSILAAFGILNYFESINGKVALIGFSDRITTRIEWTRDYDLIREEIVTNGNGGTKLPLQAIRNILEISRNELVTVIITDGELGNRQETMDYFRNYLNDDNRLYLFVLGKRRTVIDYESLKNFGAKVYQAQTAQEFCEEVFADLN